MAKPAGSPVQAALPGFDAAPRPTDRLFFAIQPDADTAARIAALAQQLRVDLGLKGHALATQRLHVTLCFLGDHVGVPPQLVAAASEAVAGIVQPPFELAFDRVASFGRGRNNPLVLLGGAGLDALSAFQQALGAALGRAGLGRGAPARYTPHLTLLYDDRRVAEQGIETIAWTAREFVLVRSALGQARHTVAARWPLHG